jgi:hypothetical protein
MYGICEQLHRQRKPHAQYFLQTESEASALRELTVMMILTVAHEISE